MSEQPPSGMGDAYPAQPDTCAFCRIVAGLEGDLVLDRTDWVAFRPLGPHVPGHLLIVPRAHVPHAATDPYVTAMLFAAAADYLAGTGQQANLLTSVGPDATQTIEHVHVHVLPRGAADGLPRDWPWLRPGW